MIEINLLGHDSAATAYPSEPTPTTREPLQPVSSGDACAALPTSFVTSGGCLQAASARPVVKVAPVRVLTADEYNKVLIDVLESAEKHARESVKSDHQDLGIDLESWAVIAADSAICDVIGYGAAYVVEVQIATLAAQYLSAYAVARLLALRRLNGGRV
jgi:hypothetical protein